MICASQPRLRCQANLGGVQLHIASKRGSAAPIVATACALRRLTSQRWQAMPRRHLARLLLPSGRPVLGETKHLQALAQRRLNIEQVQLCPGSVCALAAQAEKCAVTQRYTCCLQANGPWQRERAFHTCYSMQAQQVCLLGESRLQTLGA
jgi:hypothetical protein